MKSHAYQKLMVAMLVGGNLWSSIFFLWTPLSVSATVIPKGTPREIVVQFVGDQEPHILSVPDGSDISDALRALQRNPFVAYAEPRYLYRSVLSVTPNDPLFPKQQYLAQIHTPDAWSVTTGSLQVTVALLDTGVDIDHPDLKNNIWVNQDEIPGDGIDNDRNGYVDDIHGWDFVSDTADPNPKFEEKVWTGGIQHGTLLAGIIASEGNNNAGGVGVAWRTKILPLRTFDSNGEGDAIAVVKAIDYIIDKKVDIVNMSFVGEGDSAFLRAAMKRAHEAGILIVAASGNDDLKREGVDLSARPLYPVCYDFGENAVIGVGSLDSLGQKAPFSNYGACIDVSAPGLDFTSTQVIDEKHSGFDTLYGSGWSGTSLSTGLVAGALALAKSINERFTAREVRGFLFETGDSLDDQNSTFVGKLGVGLHVSRLVQKAFDESRKKSLIGDGDFFTGAILFSTSDGSRPLELLASDGRRIATTPKQFFPYWPHKPALSIGGSTALTDIFVVSTKKRGGPHVRAFDRKLRLVADFFAYDKKFRGGIHVAFGDVDGDGFEDIVSAPGPGGGPHIKVFDVTGKLKTHFYAYHKNFRGGVRIAVGDLNADGRAEIVTTPIKPSPGLFSDVRVFDGNGVLKHQFFAYPKQSINALSLGVGDTNSDGILEIITAPAQQKGRIAIFSWEGQRLHSFYPYTAVFDRGVTLAVGDINRDARDEIIVAPASRAPAHIRIFDGSGAVVKQFFALDLSIKKGYILGVIR